jgi:hypothetical protein
MIHLTLNEMNIILYGEEERTRKKATVLHTYIVSLTMWHTAAVACVETLQ